ncbi:TPA: hypothetical protein ACF2D8_005034 [Serratia marcescens]
MKLTFPPNIRTFSQRMAGAIGTLLLITHLSGCASSYDSGLVNRNGYSIWISNEMWRYITSPDFVKTCWGTNNPGYYCKGIMINGNEDGVNWTQPYDPAKDNKLSFSYWAYPILKSNRVRGSYRSVGIALWPAGELRTDGSAYEENFTCGFPHDGGTINNLGESQCGAYHKPRCQDIGIFTADEFIADNWKSHCGFALNNPEYDTLSAFTAIMEVEKKHIDTQGQPSNYDEFLLKPWTGTDLSKIPLMAFFVNWVTLHDDHDHFLPKIDDARKLQLDFYNKSKIFAPIVVITGDDWAHPTFSGDPEYQSPEIPLNVQVFAGTKNDYSTSAFSKHK